MPSRSFLYHVYDHDDFKGKPAFSSITLSVPINAVPVAGETEITTMETKEFYSLKRDMEELRKIGSAKGIVDSGLTSVGQTYWKKDLLVLKVGKGDKHKILFTGCHHAREWISVEVPYLVAEFLIENYPAGAPTSTIEKRVKHLLDNRQIWFIPLTNPDGHEHTTLKNRFWRVNRRPIFMPEQTIKAENLDGSKRDIKVKKGTYTGVDLNRNYPSTKWGKETVATSRDPADGGDNGVGVLGRGVWDGPSAGSEPEVKAIVALIKKENFKASISYHNFSQLLLYPGQADDAGDTFTKDLGQGMTDLIGEKGNPYTYQSGADLYPTTGDSMEYSYEAMPKRPTYTPELRPKGDEVTFGDRGKKIELAFSGLPEDQIGPCFQENIAAALALINAAPFDELPEKKTFKWTWGAKPKKIQVVRQAWKAFQGWPP